jgi:hypothetical protein
MFRDPHPRIGHERYRQTIALCDAIRFLLYRAGVGVNENVQQ